MPFLEIAIAAPFIFLGGCIAAMCCLNPDGTGCCSDGCTTSRTNALYGNIPAYAPAPVSLGFAPRYTAQMYRNRALGGGYLNTYGGGYGYVL